MRKYRLSPDIPAIGRYQKRYSYIRKHEVSIEPCNIPAQGLVAVAGFQGADATCMRACMHVHVYIHACVQIYSHIHAHIFSCVHPIWTGRSYIYIYKLCFLFHPTLRHVNQLPRSDAVAFSGRRRSQDAGWLASNWAAGL